MRVQGFVQVTDGSVRVVEEHGPSYEAASSAVRRHLREGEQLLAVSRIQS